MSDHPSDPWVEVRTYNNFAADQVISALQKEIRRGHAENAALLAYEMVITSPELEDYMWRRLMIICVEDIGFGEVQAPVVINALYEMVSTFEQSVGERKLFAIHAARFLCECSKDRSSDELVNWISHSKTLPTIPDYALDMHTAAGQAQGRSRQHFFEEGARVNPEKEVRNTTWLERILEMIADGQMD